jgi:hypothetical protein
MLRMCVCIHSRFIKNHPIQILEDGPLISEVVLSHWSWLENQFLSEVIFMPQHQHVHELLDLA